MLEKTSLQLMCTSSNDIRRINTGTHYPSIESKQAITNAQTKMERNMLNINKPENKQLSQTWFNKSEDGSGPAGYEITDGQCVSPLENPTKRKDVVEEDRRDDGETNETTPGRVSYLAYQRRAQDRPMWKQQAEAFVQPCDTMTAQWWW